MKSRVIFASLILGLGLTISQADAATTTNTDDSPAANKPASAMLVNGSQTQFAAYVGQNFAKFAQTTNWVNFMSTISLYNQNPAAVLKLSPARRLEFNQAVAQLNNQLAKGKNTEASRWITQANHTARMINYLWDVERSNSEGSDIQ
ncbi:MULTISPECIES: hypothetical protein [Spirosoma]|uniref:Uncharacterized protein n=1 Tax=Spirosoma sordidisoli TaxID=2502893 RepID=A0A4Q2UNX1_9BACT|nr:MULTISPECIES: hypothetical protein [Spirosoma]RYC71124.1 hypothetical protein EQG79_02980 [Spirosoma sordidisoli]